jgi:hypothetical protein
LAASAEWSFMIAVGTILFSGVGPIMGQESLSIGP